MTMEVQSKDKENNEKKSTGFSYLLEKIGDNITPIMYFIFMIISTVTFLIYCES